MKPIRIKRIPVEFRSAQMSSELSSYVSLPAAPWEDADDARSPLQRARDLKRQGATQEEIGRALGVSAGAIQHAVARGQI
jgi:hypothetical protein